jgi:hypothetical protein
MGEHIPCNLISKPLVFPEFPINNITPPPGYGQDQDVGKIRMWARSGKCDPRGMRNSYMMMTDALKSIRSA